MRVLAAALMTAMLVGCGMDHGTGVDTRAYTALAQQISSSAAAYAAAAGSTSDVPSCQSGHAAYDAHMGPMLDHLHAMSGDMDRQMGMMAYGDMMCGADAMLAELAHHDAAACTSTDMTANHAEAARHAAAMEAWAEHQRASCAQMDGGRMGTGGSTTSCHRNADGTFTLGP